MFHAHLPYFIDRQGYIPFPTDTYRKDLGVLMHGRFARMNWSRYFASRVFLRIINVNLTKHFGLLLVVLCFFFTIVSYNRSNVPICAEDLYILGRGTKSLLYYERNHNSNKEKHWKAALSSLKSEIILCCKNSNSNLALVLDKDRRTTGVHCNMLHHLILLIWNIWC